MRLLRREVLFFAGICICTFFTLILMIFNHSSVLINLYKCHEIRENFNLNIKQPLYNIWVTPLKSHIQYMDYSSEVIYTIYGLLH